MMENLHFAIKKDSLSIKDKLVENILKENSTLKHLKGKKGVLFSSKVLANFIEKEARYQTKIIATKENRNLRSLSSGEQKKALLNYLLQQKPTFLILDSPFESLDVASVSSLKKQLIAISSEITIIQIFNRKDEILSIITNVLDIENDKIKANKPINKYKFKEQSFAFKGKVPKSITPYKNIPKTIISLQNVNVVYDDKSILNNINWTIHKNEFWHLIGPNGSGKSTILSMIYGNNVKAFGQEVYLFGRKKGSGESVWEIKNKIGYFSPAILELFKRRVTLIEMVLSGFYDSIGLYKTPTTLQIKLANDWLSLLNLDDKSKSAFNDLSTAKQRLVLIARAMIKHPPLLILDEPLIDLDNKGTEIIVALINKIVAESDTTILFVSHREVENLNPNFIYELSPSKKGSLGKVKECF